MLNMIKRCVVKIMSILIGMYLHLRKKVLHFIANNNIVKKVSPFSFIFFFFLRNYVIITTILTIMAGVCFLYFDKKDIILSINVFCYTIIALITKAEQRATTRLRYRAKLERELSSIMLLRNYCFNYIAFKIEKKVKIKGDYIRYAHGEKTMFAIKKCDYYNDTILTRLIKIIKEEDIYVYIENNIFNILNGEKDAEIKQLKRERVFDKILNNK